MVAFEATRDFAREKSLVKPQRPDSHKKAATPSRMPEGSVFYEKVIPILLIGMGIVMLGLILFAAGVLLGWVSF